MLKLLLKCCRGSWRTCQVRQHAKCIMSLKNLRAEVITDIMFLKFGEWQITLLNCNGVSETFLSYLVKVLPKAIVGLFFNRCVKQINVCSVTWTWDVVKYYIKVKFEFACYIGKSINQMITCYLPLNWGSGDMSKKVPYGSNRGGQWSHIL